MRGTEFNAENQTWLAELQSIVRPTWFLMTALLTFVFDRNGCYVQHGSAVRILTPRFGWVTTATSSNANGLVAHERLQGSRRANAAGVVPSRSKYSGAGHVGRSYNLSPIPGASETKLIAS